MYSNKHICAALGVSPRWLTHLAEADIVKPSIKDATGQGSIRLYNDEDIVEILLVQHMQVAGVTHRAMKPIIKAHRKEIVGLILANSPVETVTVRTYQPGCGITFYISELRAKLSNCIRRDK